MSQPLPLMEQLKNLEQVQELDLRIDRIKREQSSLPGVLKTLDQSIHRVQSNLTVKQDQATELEKSLRQTRAALALNQDRVSRANSKLEAVHNTHEFQAANKEIDQLKKLDGSLGEQAKKIELESEQVRGEARVLEEELLKIKTERDQQASLISGQGQELAGHLDALLKERATLTNLVDRRTLRVYDRVRGARGGIGLAPALGGRCKGCNMMVPPQLYNEVQRGNQLHSCPSCHRILFIPLETVAVDGGKSASDQSSSESRKG